MIILRFLAAIYALAVMALDGYSALYLMRNKAAVNAWLEDKEPFDSSWMDRRAYLER